MRCIYLLHPFLLLTSYSFLFIPSSPIPSHLPLSSPCYSISPSPFFFVLSFNLPISPTPFTFILPLTLFNPFFHSTPSTPSLPPLPPSLSLLPYTLTHSSLHHRSLFFSFLPNQLKSQYLALTDTPYEQSNRRKGLSRLRVFGGGSSAAAGSDHHDGSTVTGTTDSEAGSRIGDSMRIRTLSYPSTAHSSTNAPMFRDGSHRLPAHWQPTQ